MDGFTRGNDRNSSPPPVRTEILPLEFLARVFVVFSQNHDQVGNRACGERLSVLVNFEAQKLAAGMTLLSPFVPLLFMGEEYGEPSPFLYFTSHGDADLIEAVRRGRREEFSEFGWGEEVPILRTKRHSRNRSCNIPYKILIRIVRCSFSIRSLFDFARRII